MNGYLRALIAHYQDREACRLSQETLQQAKRCVLDLSGCMLAAVPYCEKELAFIAGQAPGAGPCFVPGTGLRLPAPWAAFSGSVLASALEMDDATAVGASVHPGCCVIPAALTAAQQYPCSGRDFLRAVLFGYDLCNRLGLLATEQIRALGLYGPGFLAAPCAAAVTAFLMNCGTQTVESAVSIALSLTPACPFSAFTDGADCKNLYSGWGVYLGVLAASMAAVGMTGPRDILRSRRSMQAFFSSDKGMETPAESQAFSTAVVFKDYAACLSVCAAASAIQKILGKRALRPEEIRSVRIETYPYACELSELSKNLTPISAKTSLPYTAAVMLLDGRLDPCGFTQERLQDERVLTLMQKTEVICMEAYGAGPFGRRGSRVEITLQSGETLCAEVEESKWGKENPPSDEELLQKFDRITAGQVGKERGRALKEAVFRLDSGDDLQSFLSLLSETL